MKPSKQDPRDIMGSLRIHARANLQPLVDSMAGPNLHDPSVRRLFTRGQRRLAKKHGTPIEFANAVSESVGEISYGEAEAAIRKYAREWADA